MTERNFLLVRAMAYGPISATAIAVASSFTTRALMTVEFTFEKGGIGALHSHPHVQASYIAEGLFEVTIDGKTETLARRRHLHRAVKCWCMASRRWKPDA